MTMFGWLGNDFRDLRDLFIHEVQDLYDTEKRLIEALPQMADAASSAQLKQAFQMHEQQTEQQARRLELVFKSIGCRPERAASSGMKGLINQGQEMAGSRGDPTVRDAALIAAAQQVEHYEIAGYGSARTFARQLGLNDVAQTLQQSLDEEAQTDRRLTQIAESSVNPQAAH